MALVVHPHPRVEALVEALAAELQRSWPEHPLEPVPMVVGTRGMETWLRHALTTMLGSLSSVEFAFPSAAFEGASAWLRGERAGFEPETAPRARFWAPLPLEDSGWRGPALSARTLTAVRTCLAEGAAELEPLAHYLASTQAVPGGDVEPLEHELATQIGAALERWLHDRPDEALRALNGEPAGVEVTPWLARILRALHQGPHAATSPLTRLEALRALAPRETGRAMFVFGLSTLRPGDLLRLKCLARFMEIHLFVMAPSVQWLGDLMSPEHLRALARRPEMHRAAEAARAVAHEQNSLLAANAGPTRDLQAWVFRCEEEGTDVRDAVTPDAYDPVPEPMTALGHLQRWIAGACGRSANEAVGWPSTENDTSIERHATRGPLRQCEALRDALLARFDNDPTLQARHVVVMTPDLATYAPLVAAVFGRSNRTGAPPLPVTIADLGLRSTNPIADAVLAVLALTHTRVTASALADLVTMEPVRARFGLNEAEAQDLVASMQAAGLRWGWDADDRAARADVPRSDQNTVRFALERLALGALMPDAGGVEVVQGAPVGDVPWGPAAPLALRVQAKIETVGALIALVDALESAHRALSTPATPAIWRTRLKDCVDALTTVPPKRAWQRLDVLSTLDDVLPDAPETYTPQAVAVLLAGAFDLPQRGDRVFGGSITLCALEPMRSVPFRVVALLGMDDAAFPRQAVPNAWDPMAKPKPGESDRRTIDRHLFLEAVMSARDALLVFYTGFEPKQDKAQPPSVVVEELFEVVERGAGKAYAEPVEHPLQPWSLRRFSEVSTRPFDDFLVEAAKARHGATARSGASGQAQQLRERPRLSPRQHPNKALTTSDLTSALTRPQYLLLKGRLGIDLYERDQTLEEREPIEPGKYAVSDLAEELAPLWARAEGPPAIDALEARLRAEGKLMVGEAGRLHLREVVAAITNVTAHRATLTGTPLGPTQYTVQLKDDVSVATPLLAECLKTEEGVALVRRVYQVKPQDHVWVQAVYDATVAQAALRGEVSVVAVLVTAAGCKRYRPLGRDAAESLDALERTAGLWERAHCEALLLFKKTSQEIAKKAPLPRPDDSAEAVGEGIVEAVLSADKQWVAEHGNHGDRDKTWVKPLFGELTIEDLAEPETAVEVFELAKTFWKPLLDADEMATQGSAKGQPSAESSSDSKEDEP